MRADLLKPAYTLIALLWLLVSLGGCRQNAPHSLRSEEEHVLALDDSISAGNPEWTRREVDRRQREALAAGDSSLWAALLTTRGKIAFYTSDISHILPPADSALSYAARHPEEKWSDFTLRIAARVKGSYYSQYAHTPDSAIIYQQLSLDHTSRENVTDYLLQMANLADAYKMNSRFAMAADTYQRAILAADSLHAGNASYEILYSGLAGTYSAMGDFDHAQIWWDRVMELYPEMTPYARFTNLNNLGNHYYLAHKYPQALATFNRLESLLDSLGAGEWERSFCLANKADVFLQMQQTDSAYVLLKQVAPYFEEVAAGTPVADHIRTLQMRLNQQRGNYARVEELVERYPVTPEMRDELLRNRLEVLTGYYSHTGQWREAFRTLSDYHTLRDSLVSAQVRQTLGAQRLAYERDTSLLTLRGDNSRKQLSIYRLTVILVVALLIIMVLVTVFWVRRRRARRHEEKMLQKIIALRMESHRGRLTPHFIYNALQQVLAAEQREGRSGEQAATGASAATLEAIIRLLRQQQVVAESITIPLSEELAFLSDYVALQGGRSRAPLDFSIDIAPGIETERVEIPTMTLQILAENAFKHSFPKLPAEETRRLKVTVAPAAGGRVAVTVANNTPSPDGKEERTAPPGIGLRIITETIAYLNATRRSDITFTLATPPGFWEATITL